MLHEFKALLFAQPGQIVRMFPDVRQADRLLTDVSGLATEEIEKDKTPVRRRESVVIFPVIVNVCMAR